jgi:hypothetical protein
VRWRWLKSLKRRSQRAFMSWEKFTSITDRKRADPLDIDLSGFGPAPPAKPKAETAAVRQVSEANDFHSRAPAGTASQRVGDGGPSHLS